jgi:hypothetical protein
VAALLWGKNRHDQSTVIIIITPPPRATRASHPRRAEGQLLKLPATKFTVREREMLIGSGILPPEFFAATKNPFVLGVGARERRPGRAGRNRQPQATGAARTHRRLRAAAAALVSAVPLAWGSAMARQRARACLKPFPSPPPASPPLQSPPPLPVLMVCGFVMAWQRFYDEESADADEDDEGLPAKA